MTVMEVLMLCGMLSALGALFLFVLYMTRGPK